MMPKMRVGEISEQVRGVTYSKGEAADSPRQGHVALLRAGNIGETGIDFDDLVYVPERRVSSKQRLQPGDVLIAASSGSLSVVGKAGLVREPTTATFGAFCKVLRPNPEIDPAFFAHYFRTPTYRTKISYLASGANINNLKNSDLDNLEIPLPPLAEQRRIAAILDQADELRTKRRHALTLLDELADALFIDMFGTSDEARGESVALADLGRIVTGKTPPGALDGMYGDFVPFVTPGDLGRDSKPSRGLSESGAETVPLVATGSLLVCCIGATIGKMGMVSEKAAFNQQINAVEWGPKVDPTFGLFAVREKKAEIIHRASSTTMPILNKGTFQKIELCIPEMALQEAFATNIAALKRLANSAHSENVVLDELFASLQHRAFRGEL